MATRLTRIFPVIMSGGAGTRLWPVSTENFPKPFHALLGGASLFEQAARRTSGKHGEIEFLDPIVICGQRHRDLVVQHLGHAGRKPAALVLEPMGRNTAATAALAALTARDLDPEALVLLMPADHVVTDPEAFIRVIAAATKVARDRIVTFGIEPSYPETGYGYIEGGEELSPGVFAVKKFHEKPQADLASRYITQGFTWNSGVFFFSPKVMLEEFAHAGADIVAATDAAYAAAERKGVEVWLKPDTFGAVRSESVDIAVMQSTRKAAVAPCDIGWADVGSWSEVWRLAQQDAARNAVIGRGNVATGEGNLVLTTGPRVTVSGVDGLMIIATGDEVLVLPRDRAQDVKKLIPKD